VPRQPTATLGISAFGPDIEATVRIARAADAAGVPATWTSELYNRSVTIPLAAMATVTERTLLGAAIAYGVGRSPMTLAAEARDLDELSHGRFVLGLGNGTRTMIRDWHGQDPEAPAVRIEELVPLIRAIWNVHERPVDHDGRFYRMRFRPIGDPPAIQRAIPIHTAGLNPRMCESAGRVADGIIAHPVCSAKYLQEVVAPAVAKGAARSERAVEEIELASMVICVVHDDLEQARRDAASQISFYGSVKTYDAAFALNGFAANAEAIREAFRAGDEDAMRVAVSDEMVDAMAVCGRTASEVRAGLRRYDGVLDHAIAYSPTHGLSAERVEENIMSLVEVAAS
jgi:probable F420-dependent oxidoreductase